MGDGPPRRIGGGPTRAAAVESAGFIDKRIVAAARRTERRGEPFAAIALPRFAFGVFVEGVEGSRGDAARFCAIAGRRGGDADGNRRCEDEKGHGRRSTHSLPEG